MKSILGRVLLLLLCAALMIGVLSGCGAVNEPDTTDPSAADPAVTDPAATEDVVPVPTPGAVDDPSKPTAPKRPDDGDGVVNVDEEELPYSEAEIYGQLFDLNNKIEINVDMPAAELQKMQDDYNRYRDKGSKSPIYRKADVIITITTVDGTNTTYRIPEVGVRMKGNTSRTDFYNAGDGGIYKYIHLRLDFQETFDDRAYYGSEAKVWDSEDEKLIRKDRTFGTLQKLELRWNKCYDSTYLKETYAYELYRSEGVPAPRSNLSSVDWGGVHMGVYVIAEPVDKAFLKKYLPEEEIGGDLYKCGWTYTGATFTNLDSIGIENEDNGEFYIYDLKTNKKTSQHESLTKLITQLNGVGVTKESYAELVDVDRFLSFAAVSYFLGNPDDLRNNYNNFYLYFLASSGKAIFIPYDYDRCLGVTYEYNPSGNGLTTDNPFSDVLEAGQHGRDPQRNPLYIYSVSKGGYYVKEFADVLNRVAENELLLPETFESYFNRAEALYRNDVQPSKKLYNADGRDLSFALNASSGGNLSFSSYITAKKASFSQHMQNLDQYINYVRPEPVNYYIRGDFNDWSNRDEYGMTNEDGLLTHTLSFNHDCSFKVYHDPSGEWLGVECLDENTTVYYRTNDHGNIILSAGTYLVTYDPETKIITVTEQ